MNFLLPKREVVRDKEYRRHVASLPCRACGAPETQAAHLGHSSMSKKEGDDLCVPLCPTCHMDMDQGPLGKEKWWVKYVAIPEARRAYQRYRREMEMAG